MVKKIKENRLNMRMERYLLRISLDIDAFPGHIQVDEEGVKVVYCPTGYAYVQDDKVLVEYKLSDMTCYSLPYKQLKKKEN